MHLNQYTLSKNKHTSSSQNNLNSLAPFLCFVEFGTILH